MLLLCPTLLCCHNLTPYTALSCKTAQAYSIFFEALLFFGKESGVYARDRSKKIPDIFLDIQ